MGTGARDDLIYGCLDALGRGEFLQRGFRMLGRAALAGKIRLPQLEDEPLRRLHPAVEEQGADQRFDHAADDILALARADASRLLAQACLRRYYGLAVVPGATFEVDQS